MSNPYGDDSHQNLNPPEGKNTSGMGQIIVDMSSILTAAKEKENLSKYQMIAAGFFAQTREPALTINENKIGVNAAAARLFPDVDYMEILINTEERKVAFKPCDELTISGYKWARDKDGKRYATQRTGLPFVLCVCKVMGWDPNKRWRILGKKLRSETDEEILLFDLKAAQGFDKPDTGKDGKKSRPTILTGWDGTFGPTYGENYASLQVGTFDKYTYFSIKNGEVQKEEQAQDKNQGGLSAGAIDGAQGDEQNGTAMNDGAGELDSVAALAAGMDFRGEQTDVPKEET